MAPKTGVMRQVRKNDDPLSMNEHGDGDIIPLMATIGAVTIIAMTLSSGFTQTDVIAIGCLWYGALGIFALANWKQTVSIMRLKEVDEFGSSGSFVRMLGNLVLAGIVVGGVATFALWAGW